MGLILLRLQLILIATLGRGGTHFIYDYWAGRHKKAQGEDNESNIAGCDCFRSRQTLVSQCPLLWELDASQNTNAAATFRK